MGQFSFSEHIKCTLKVTKEVWEIGPTDGRANVTAAAVGPPILLTSDYMSAIAENEQDFFQARC